MFYAAFYSPEQLKILDDALECAMREVAPRCAAEPPSESLRVAVATAILGVAEVGITDADRMASEALQLMRQQWGLGGQSVLDSSPTRGRHLTE